MTAFIICTAIIIFCLLLVLFGGLFGFIFACGRRKSRFDPSRLRENSHALLYYNECAACAKELEEKTSEEIFITARDGEKITARLFLNGEKNRFIILVHGYRSDWIRDFGAIARFWYENDYSLLILAGRAHGESGGRYICYGAKERYDICDFSKYLSQKYTGCKILLHGISMGGASVMMAAATDLPENVKGIIDDCGYTTPFEIIERVSALPGIFNYSLCLWARALAGISLRRASALEAAKKSDLPKLIIHGEKDKLVPFEMGQRIYKAANGDKTFLSVPDAGHANSFYIQPEMMKTALADFAEKTMR